MQVAWAELGIFPDVSRPFLRPRPLNLNPRHCLAEIFPTKGQLLGPCPRGHPGPLLLVFQLYLFQGKVCGNGHGHGHRYCGGRVGAGLECLLGGLRCAQTRVPTRWPRVGAGWADSELTLVGRELAS